MKMTKIGDVEYPACPSLNSRFIMHWGNLIQDVYERDNFKTSHLHTLKILVDLYMDYDTCRDMLNMHGYTYESEGRNGVQIKKRPEADMLAGHIKDIAAFSKLLGITLHKDIKTKDPSAGKSEWD